MKKMLLSQKSLKDREESGFSLLEVMIAAAIFAIVALGVAQYQVLLIQRRVVHQRYTQAINFAQEKMEDVKRQGYDNAAASSEPYSTGINGDTHFSRAVTVTSGTNYKEVTVTVSWKDPNGQQHNPGVVLKTIIGIEEVD